MPVKAPNPVKVSDINTSGGSIREYANQLRFVGTSRQDGNLWSNVVVALNTVATQIDLLSKALRANAPIEQLTQITDGMGNLVAAIGDMVGANNQGFSGIWQKTLSVGGSGPGDTNGLTIGATSSGNGANFSGPIQISGVQVVESRRTGWSAPSGTVSRATFDQATVTLPQLAQRLAALITDLESHGLIGP